MDNSNKEWAYECAARGWLVFPSLGKRPLVKWGTESTRDKDVIKVMWDTWPDADVCIKTGAASGLVVVDWDSYKQEGGDVWPLDMYPPNTYLARTPKGGYHFYFQHPACGKICTCVNVENPNTPEVCAPPATSAGGWSTTQREPNANVPSAVSGTQLGHRGTQPTSSGQPSGTGSPLMSTLPSYPSPAGYVERLTSPARSTIVTPPIRYEAPSVADATPVSDSSIKTEANGSREHEPTCPKSFRVANSAGLLAPYVDVRGDGGMVVAYPPVLDRSLAPIPKAWAKERRTVTEQVAPIAEPYQGDGDGMTLAVDMLEFYAKEVLNAAEGTLNTTLWKRSADAFKMVAAGELNEKAALKLLVQVAVAAGHPVEGAIQTVQSGRARGMLEPTSCVQMAWKEKGR